jgi:hypothetical protein
MRLDHYDTHQLRSYAAERLDIDHVPDPLWNKSAPRLLVDYWDNHPDKRVLTQEELVAKVRRSWIF